MLGNSYWEADRDNAAKYRHYLVHEGILYTVHLQATGEILVMGPAAFTAGVSWVQADASYNANPDHWRPAGEVAKAVIDDTIAFIDLAYGRLLGVMDPLLANPTYQAFWGWKTSTPTFGGAHPALPNMIASIQACSASKMVGGNPTVTNIFSTGGRKESRRGSGGRSVRYSAGGISSGSHAREPDRA